MPTSASPDVRELVLKTAEASLNIPVDENTDLSSSQFTQIMTKAAEELGLPPNAVKNGVHGGRIGSIIEMLEVIVYGVV